MQNKVCSDYVGLIFRSIIAATQFNRVVHAAIHWHSDDSLPVVLSSQLPILLVSE